MDMQSGVRFSVGFLTDLSGCGTVPRTYKHNSVVKAVPYLTPTLGGWASATPDLWLPVQSQGTPLLNRYQIYCLLSGTCVNNLPRVTRKQNGWWLNRQPFSGKSQHPNHYGTRPHTLVQNDYHANHEPQQAFTYHIKVQSNLAISPLATWCLGTDFPACYLPH